MNEDTGYFGGCACGALRFKVAYMPNGPVENHYFEGRDERRRQAINFVRVARDDFQFEKGERDYDVIDGATCVYCLLCGTLTVVFEPDGQTVCVDISRPSSEP